MRSIHHHHDPPRSRLTVPLVALLAAPGFAGPQGGTTGSFPEVAFPPGNPSTPEKVQLGKALFFEEQLSVDGTMACASCHLPEAGGADVNAGAREPGVDGLLGTPDDEFGSPGVVRQDAVGDYAHHPVFGVERQATPRNAPSVIGAAFFRSLFWDLRAGPVFLDEADGVVLEANAALETLAAQPPLSSVEMGHEGVTWVELEARLAGARPLALATKLPAELASFVGEAETYGPLFEATFGDPAVTRERVAMAIATYLRTLVPDRTPFDQGLMTAQQRRGLDLFLTAGNCVICHPPANGLFSDGLAHIIGLPDHSAVVKAPSLRNVGLRRRFMHSGQFGSLQEVLDHYTSINFLVGMPPEDRSALEAFLAEALTDPRVARAEPPFDRPVLRGERRPPGSELYGAATASEDGHAPRMLATAALHLTGGELKLGLGHATGAGFAVLALSSAPARASAPGGGPALWIDRAMAELVLVPLAPAAPGQAVGTARLDLDALRARHGATLFAQWFVADPAALGSFAASEGAEVPF